MSDDLSAHTNIRWNGNIGVAEFGGGARGQHAIFYNKSVHNPLKSQQEGRPVFDDRIYIRVAPPGERLNVVDRPATRQDQQIWPQQWAAFQQNKEQTAEGTHIELLYPEKPAVAATLRANGVHTIEQCAELSGNALDNIGMGAQTWANMAIKYLEHSKKGVAMAQFRKELDERDGQLRVQALQIEQLRQEVAALRSNSSAGNVDLAKIQEMLAGAMSRPQMPPSEVTRSPKFDVATAQINATHPTALEAKRKKRVKP
jgi:hypothetical protein